MDCIDARPLLFAFADQELDVGQYVKVMDHLKVCPRCVETIADYQSLGSGVGRIVEDDPMPMDLFARVMTRINGEQVARLYSPTW